MLPQLLRRHPNAPAFAANIDLRPCEIEIGRNRFHAIQHGYHRNGKRGDLDCAFIIHRMHCLLSFQLLDISFRQHEMRKA